MRPLPRLRGVRGLAILCGIALFALNAVVFLVYTLPRLLEERSLSARSRTLADEVSREKRFVEALKHREYVAQENIRDQERLYHTLLLPPGRGIVPMIEELNRLGNEAGLSWAQQSYQTKPVNGAPLLQMGIAVPFSGLYPQMIDFLTKIEGSKRFFVVDGIQLHSRADEAGDLAIQLSAYFYGEEQK
ncbi:MAG TPA: type 4a pilus biogenesis protein PilO [Vicinamibacteria bacterium]|nr:type 4a pilus biogenesis protein PilO [Vicinamibacteria bacterium]